MKQIVLSQLGKNNYLTDWCNSVCVCLQTLDPECLFSFHAGAIEGMDVSGFSHLMATTAFDRKTHYTYTRTETPLDYTNGSFKYLFKGRASTPYILRSYNFF